MIYSHFIQNVTYRTFYVTNVVDFDLQVTEIYTGNHLSGINSDDWIRFQYSHKTLKDHEKLIFTSFAIHGLYGMQ